MKYDINELYPSAQHAYNTIGLAVKTSRPRNKMANFHLSKTHFIFKELPQFIIERRNRYLCVRAGYPLLLLGPICKKTNLSCGVTATIPNAKSVVAKTTTVGKDTPKSIPKKVLIGCNHKLHLKP